MHDKTHSKLGGRVGFVFADAQYSMAEALARYRAKPEVKEQRRHAYRDWVERNPEKRRATQEAYRRRRATRSYSKAYRQRVERQQED